MRNQALVIFYETHVCKMLYDHRYGFHIMSDDYILHDLLAELRNKP